MYKVCKADVIRANLDLMASSLRAPQAKLMLDVGAWLYIHDIPAKIEFGERGALWFIFENSGEAVLFKMVWA